MRPGVDMGSTIWKKMRMPRDIVDHRRLLDLERHGRKKSRMSQTAKGSPKAV